MRAVDFSVIVPAYNAASTIGDCLAALMLQSIPRERYEVIVVDDGSTDSSADIAAQHGARVVRQANQGQAAARNHGVAEALGSIIFFTDADCEPTPRWLADLSAPFADAAIAGDKGAYRTRQRSLAARFVQLEYEERYEHMSRARYIDFVDTYSAAYRRDVFLQNGGFDTSFPGDSSGEDQEFSFRLSERGYKMLFVPTAIVYHRHPSTVAAYIRRKFKTGYWKALVLRLHPEKAVRDTHTPGSLKLQMAVVAATLPVLLGGALLHIFWPAALVMAVLLAGVFAEFTVKACTRDTMVGLVAPFMLTIRAIALGSGLMMGLWDAVRQGGPLMAHVPRHRSRDDKHATN